MPGQTVNRRAAIGAIAAFALPLAALGDGDAYATIEQALAIVTMAMVRLHGGQWHAHIDHIAGFILIGPRTDPAPSA